MVEQKYNLSIAEEMSYRVYVKNTNDEIKDIDEDEIRTFMQG